MMNHAGKQRIEYIDIIRGLSIVWVVMIHTLYTDNTEANGTQIMQWLFVPYRMPLFFFLSGIFFRASSFQNFIKKRIKTIIIPFLGFWFIGFLYSVVKYELIANIISMEFNGNVNFAEYATALKGLFHLHPKVAPCIVNEPLWFLIVLFFAQFSHFLFCTIVKKKSIIIFIGIALFIAGTFFRQHGIVTGLFYLTRIWRLYIYYAIGNFWGKDLMNMFQQNRHLKKMLIPCLSVLIFMPLIQEKYYLITEILILVRSLCFFPVIFFVCKSISHLKFTNPLKYCGIHSLEILVTHSIIASLIFSSTKVILNDVSFTGDISCVFFYLVFPLTMALEYFLVIKFCNKYLFFLLGKFTQQHVSTEIIKPNPMNMPPSGF